MLESLNAIRSLKLPAVVEDLYFARPVSADIQLYLKYPTEFHNRSLQDCGVLTAGGLIPILSDTNFSDIYCFDPLRSKFVMKSVEEPDTIQHEFDGWQQFVGYKLLEIADSGASDDELISVADALGFTYTAALVSLLHQMEELSDDDSQRLAEEFIQTCT